MTFTSIGSYAMATAGVPEGVILEVPEVETFEPIVLDQPGVPTFGLTLID